VIAHYDLDDVVVCLSDAMHHIHCVPVRQGDPCHDEIELLLRNLVQCFMLAGGLVDLISLTFQEIAQLIALYQVVIHDQDALHMCHGLATLSFAAASTGLALLPTLPAKGRG
jgi:hypothetical protein